MKIPLFPVLVTAALTATTFAGNLGPGPWANDTYYPGNIDGQYQAAVFGNNIAGVLGFALRNGAPTVATTSEVVGTNTTQSTLTVDPFQNYFAVFVEGRTYTGLTTASVNYNSQQVTGALIGAQPDFAISNASFNPPLEITNISSVTSVPVTNTFVSTNIVVTNAGGLFVTNAVFQTNLSISSVLVTNFTVDLIPQPPGPPSVNPSALVNRGLNGGFQAKIRSDKAVFTFRGDGNLSTPAQFQTVNLTTNSDGFVVGAVVETQTVPFQLNGIRVSFTTLANTAAAGTAAQ